VQHEAGRRSDSPDMRVELSPRRVGKPVLSKVGQLYSGATDQTVFTDPYKQILWSKHHQTSSATLSFLSKLLEYQSIGGVWSNFLIT
jgi:hypothetical protein